MEKLYQCVARPYGADTIRRSVSEFPHLNRASASEMKGPADIITTRKIFGICIVLSFAAAACTTAPTVIEDRAAPTLVFPPPPDIARFIFERTIRSSADVVSVDRDTRWRRLLTGETSSATGLAKPFDVTVCQGKIYISDTVRRSVLVFDVPNGEFREIGLSDPGLLLKPLGLATDAECNLYVVDATARRVVVYNQHGEYITALGGREWFDRPSHVEVDPDGQYIYCVDTGGVDSERHHIRVFHVSSGEHVRDIGSRGTRPGQFNLARDITLGTDGLLYIVDGGNFRVQVFRQNGFFVREFGGIGMTGGQFARPKGIDTDPEGNIYVSDAAFGNFQIFDRNGQLLLYVGSRSETPEPAKYMLPAGIAVDEDGRVYMIDQFFRKLDVYRPAALAENQGYLGARLPQQ